MLNMSSHSIVMVVMMEAAYPDSIDALTMNLSRLRFVSVFVVV